MMRTSSHFLQTFNALKTQDKWEQWITAPFQEGAPEKSRVHLRKIHILEAIVQEIRGFKHNEVEEHMTFRWGDKKPDCSATCKDYRNLVASDLEQGLCPLLEIQTKAPHKLWDKPPHGQRLSALITLHPHLLNRGGLYDAFPSCPIPWMPLSVGNDYIVPQTRVGQREYRPRLSVSMMPPGMYVGAHIDECIPKIVWQILGIQLWLCWPGSPANAAQWNERMNDSRTLKWCFDNLKDLRAILLKPGEEIIIPTGEYHAVLSLTPSIHFSMKYLCSNSAAISLNHRRRQLQAFHNPLPNHHGYPLLRSQIHHLDNIIPQLYYKPFEDCFPDVWEEALDDAARMEEEELSHQAMMEEKRETEAQVEEGKRCEAGNEQHSEEDFVQESLMRELSVGSVSSDMDMGE